MAKLAPSHVRIQIIRRKLETGRKPLDNSRQARAMRFPSGRKPDASHAMNLQARLRSSVRQANGGENRAWQGSRLEIGLCPSRADDAAGEGLQAPR
jgi:hypothetical protein